MPASGEKTQPSARVTRGYRQRGRIWRTGLLVLVASGCVGAVRTGEADREQSVTKARIEFLLKALQTSELTFVREGKEYSGRQAADHLRAKWQMAGARIQTPQDFIAACATRSGTTGTEYEVVLADGKTRIPSAAWLGTVLSAHELTLSSSGGTDRNNTGRIDEERIRALFVKLGHDDFETREQATADLLRMGPEVAEVLAKLAKDSKDPEVIQRCTKIREALQDLDQTAMGVLRYIEQSDGRFFRPGGSRTNYDAPRFSAHLQGKALLFNFSLTRPAKEFVEQIAGRSSLHNRNYRIRLPDGTEMDVKAWLGKRFRLE